MKNQQWQDTREFHIDEIWMKVSPNWKGTPPTAIEKTGALLKINKLKCRRYWICQARQKKPSLHFLLRTSYTFLTQRRTRMGPIYSRKNKVKKRIGLSVFSFQYYEEIDFVKKEEEERLLAEKKCHNFPLL